MRRITKTVIVVAILGLVTMVSCRKPKIEEYVPGGRWMTFGATTDNGNSKTAIDSLQVKWKKGDQIKVNGVLFTTQADDEKQGTFTGIVGDDFQYPYCAGYPADWTTYTSQKTLELHIPSLFTYSAQCSEDSTLVAMAACNSASSDLFFEFKNATNILKINFSGKNRDDHPDLLRNITLTCIGSNINGIIPVTITGEEPTFDLISDGSTISIVNFGSDGSGLALSPTVTRVYIPLPKIAGTASLKLRFNCYVWDEKEGKYELKYMPKDIPVDSLGGKIVEVNHIFSSDIIVVATEDEKEGPRDVVCTVECTSDFVYTCGGSFEIYKSQTCEYGVVYSETENVPELGKASCEKTGCIEYIDVDDRGNTIQFNIDVSNLPSNKNYKVRSYVIGENGIVVYSPDIKTLNTGNIPQPLPTNWINGTIPYEFSVSSTKKVYFSQGNLQYIGEGTHSVAGGGTDYGTWSFANHQFDYLADNGQFSHSQTVRRDLFGWGTSRWDNGNIFYKPFDVDTIDDSSRGYGYGPTDGHKYDNDLTGDYANSDWGVYNAISNGGNEPNQWRTLTQLEWQYLIETRSSGSSWGLATIGGCQRGIVILPDSWTPPSGLSFTPGKEDEYRTNAYTYQEWSAMESNGAVFLPAAGNRELQSYQGHSQGSECGMYWSSSQYGTNQASRFSFEKVNVNASTSRKVRHHGYSVRLVKDVTP